MPNGWDRNWVRFRITVLGFKAMYGAWPRRVIAVDPMPLAAIRELFTPATFARLTAHLAISERNDLDGEPWDGYFYAEDDRGNRITYGEALHGRKVSEQELIDWLGINGPDAPHTSH